MDKIAATIVFVIFFIICAILTNRNDKLEKRLLYYTLIVLTFFVGLRNPMGWSDTVVYSYAFDQIQPLGYFSFHDSVYGYSEKGFLLLSAFIKIFTKDAQVYFVIIAGLTYLMLYKNLRRYSFLPLIGLCVYLARFMTGREMTQIRAALAIMVIIWGIQYVRKNEYVKLLLVLFVAYSFHTSAIVALPMLFFNKFTMNKMQIVVGLMISFLVAGFYGYLIKDIVSTSDFVNEMARSYVDEGSDKAFSSSLANPVIYYQTIILLLFTFYEKKLSNAFPFYYIVRNAYFYSTVILIVLCQYAVLAARTSTIFATLECIMIPMIVLSFNSKARWICYAVLLFGYSILFYFNWSYQL